MLCPCRGSGLDSLEAGRRSPIAPTGTTRDDTTAAAELEIGPDKRYKRNVPPLDSHFLDHTQVPTRDDGLFEYNDAQLVGDLRAAWEWKAFKIYRTCVPNKSACGGRHAVAEATK